MLCGVGAVCLFAGCFVVRDGCCLLCVVAGCLVVVRCLLRVACCKPVVWYLLCGMLLWVVCCVVFAGHVVGCAFVCVFVVGCVLYVVCSLLHDVCWRWGAFFFLTLPTI